MLPCAASSLIAQVPSIYMTVFQARWQRWVCDYCHILTPLELGKIYKGVIGPLEHRIKS